MSVQFPELPSSLERVEMARTDYLYGMPGGKPTRDTKALARKYDLTTMEITRHSGSWLAELRANAKTASLVYGKALELDTIDAHERDVAWIREQIDILQKRMDDIPLEGKGLESYDFILKQVLKLQVRWSQLSGVEGALKVSNLVKLTVARAEAQDAINKELESQKPAPSDNEIRPVSGKIFDMEAPASSPVIPLA